MRKLNIGNPDIDIIKIAVALLIVTTFIGSAILPVVGSQFQEVTIESSQLNEEKSIINTISKEETRLSVSDYNNNNNQVPDEGYREDLDIISDLIMNSPDSSSSGRGSDDPPTFYEDTGRWYNKPSSYDELITWYQNLEQNFSDYLEIWKANEMYGTGKIPDADYDLYFVRNNK